MRSCGRGWPAARLTDVDCRAGGAVTAPARGVSLGFRLFFRAVAVHRAGICLRHAGGHAAAGGPVAPNAGPRARVVLVWFWCSQLGKPNGSRTLRYATLRDCRVKLGVLL
jgi:hypothetical protein